MRRYLIFGLSLLGLLIASYLSYEYLTASSINCPIGGVGCDTVRLSPYSSFFGISTPLYGVAYYFSMMISVVLISAGFLTNLIKKLQLWATVFAVLFGIYLTYLEGFVINAYCTWCVTSFIISILILGCIIFSAKKTNDN